MAALFWFGSDPDQPQDAKKQNRPARGRFQKQ